MGHTEMPIFTRTFDFISWLLPVTNNFPRAHRHTLTRRLRVGSFNNNRRNVRAAYRTHARRARNAAVGGGGHVASALNELPKPGIFHSILA